MMRSLKLLRFYVLLFFAVLLVLLAVAGPWLAPEDPLRIDIQKVLRPPDRENLFGTDRLGRDLFSRILYGARDSFALTLLMVLIVTCVGSVIGSIAGYLGGPVDTVLMHIADVLLAFPSLVFVIAITGIWGPGIYHTVLALSIVCWAKYARMTRALVVDIRGRDYITLARFGGARWPQIFFRYILPNALPQIVIMTTLDIGEMMLTLSSLSFLGLVGQPPAPEWGNMLEDGKQFLMTEPYMMLFPSLAILITVVVFNLLGDSLRDILDPKEIR